MSSLKRRLSIFTTLTADQSSSSSTDTCPPSDQTYTSKSAHFNASTVPMRRPKTSFKRRVTITLESIFTPRGRSAKRREEKGGITGDYQPRWSYVSRSPSPPSPDIRPPSGLGHRASFDKSRTAVQEFIHELDGSELPYAHEGHINSASLWRDHFGQPYETSFHAESSPDLTVAIPPPVSEVRYFPRPSKLRRPATAITPSTTWYHSPPPLSFCKKVSSSKSNTRVTPPSLTRRSAAPEAMPLILPYCDHQDLTSLLRVSHVIKDAVLPVLYRQVHFDDINPSMRTSCLQTLASQSEIAKHVRTFSWNTIVPSASTPDITRTYFLGHALQNMNGLCSLSLTHTDVRLLTHISARLASFTSRGLSSLDAASALAAWLSTQPSIVSLALPDMFCLPLAPGALPALTQFTGTTSVAGVVVPTRPVSDVGVHLCTPIYDGLRPSELMDELACSSAKVLTLRLSMTRRVDPRTHERVIKAAGAKLPDLREIQVQWPLEPQDLYPQITCVLPLFSKLKSLILRLDDSYHAESDTHSLHSKEGLTADVWLRQCPSLRHIEFLSGSTWHS